MRASLTTTIHAARAFSRLVLSRFAEDRCLQVAGDLTFTTLLALVPLFTIAFALFAAFPMFDDWSNAFKVFLLTTLVPEMGGKVITVYMQQFADNAAKLTAIGLVFLGVTALALMSTIERVFNLIWRVNRPRPVMQRLVIYWAALTVGPILVGASLSLTSWLVTQSITMTTDVKELQTFLLKTVPVVLNIAAFALLYLLIPNRRVAFKDAFIGGAAAALAFELMKRSFGLYVQLFPTYALIYGAFATVPIFLLWIYLSWIVILFGAVVVAVLPHWRMGTLQPSAQPGEPFYSALRLIERLFREQAAGRVPSTLSLAMSCVIADEQTERLLERMLHEGWVRRVESGGWILARDLSTLTLLDVYRVFVLHDSPLADAASGLANAASRLLRSGDERLAVSIRSLIDSVEGAAQPEPPSRRDSPSTTGARPAQ